MTAPLIRLLSIPSRAGVEFLSKITPIKSVNTRYGELVLGVKNPLLLYRQQSFFKKEPETLEWIDGFQDKDVFYDIGANVGLYSLYAGKKGVQTYAFEPESQNYAELNKNIYANNLADKIHALCIACSESTGFDKLYLSNFGTGTALHNFGEEKDCHGNATQSAYQQASLSCSLDELIEKYHLPTPTHLKIDVDGIEEKVILGARKALLSDQLKSVLIEINENKAVDRSAVNMLLEFGFELTGKHQSAEFSKGEFSNTYNCIFEKNAS